MQLLGTITMDNGMSLSTVPVVSISEDEFTPGTYFATINSPSELYAIANVPDGLVISSSDTFYYARQVGSARVTWALEKNYPTSIPGFWGPKVDGEYLPPENSHGITALYPTYPCIFSYGERYIPGRITNTLGTLDGEIRIADGYVYTAVNPLTDTPVPPYSPSGPSSSGGGGGTFGQGDTSDTIAVPSTGLYPSANLTGMTTRYLCDANVIQRVGSFLWTDDFFDAFRNKVAEAIVGDKAINAVTSLHAYPFNVVNDGTVSGVSVTYTESLSIGRIETLVPANRLDSDTCVIDWGTITFPKNQMYFGNFLDFSPYTKADLYLPFCTGFVNLDVCEFYPGNIRVQTIVDLVKGTCVHNVFAQSYDKDGNIQPENVIGTFQGNCAKQFPLTSDDWASRVTGAVVGAVAVAGLAVGAGLAAAGSSSLAAGEAAAGTATKAAGTATKLSGSLAYPAKSSVYREAVATQASETARAAELTATGMQQQAAAKKISLASNKVGTGALASMNTPANVARSGSFSEGAGGMQVNYPYIVFSRPRLNVPAKYGHTFGYPSNISPVNMREMIGTGYTEVGAIHWKNTGAIQPDELAELDAILKGGVYL